LSRLELVLSYFVRVARAPGPPAPRPHTLPHASCSFAAALRPPDAQTGSLGADSHTTRGAQASRAGSTSHRVEAAEADGWPAPSQLPLSEATWNGARAVQSRVPLQADSSRGLARDCRAPSSTS